MLQLLHEVGISFTRTGALLEFLGPPIPERLRSSRRTAPRPPVDPHSGRFHTAALGLPELALLAFFPVIVWGSDELRRAWRRRHDPTPTGTRRAANDLSVGQV